MPCRFNVGRRMCVGDACDEALIGEPEVPSGMHSEETTKAHRCNTVKSFIHTGPELWRDI